MCCGTPNRPANFCGCAIGAEYTPRFMTRDQQLAKLENYLVGLKEEVKAVEAYIQEMKQGK